MTNVGPTSGGTSISFDGSVPERYQRHLATLLFEPYAVDLANRLRPPSSTPRVLELACGTGILTRRLRVQLAGSGSIVATDLSEGMLAVARVATGEAPEIEWRQADATNLPFPDASFDAVACQFGVMFFPDKPRALREMHRVLRPDGQLLFNTWDSLGENPLVKLANETTTSFFPDDPPAFWHVPFGMHDRAQLRRLVDEAGFTAVEVDTVRRTGESPSAESAASGLLMGTPALLGIQERGADASSIVAAFAARIVDRFGAGPLRVPMQAHVVTARRG